MTTGDGTLRMHALLKAGLAALLGLSVTAAASPRTTYRPRCCSAGWRSRPTSSRGASAPMRAAASPAPIRCPMTDRPGRSCGCREIATGACRILVAYIEKLAHRRAAARRLARPSRRRSVAAARRSDDLGSFQPPGRPRRRHLVRSDAGLCPDRARSAKIGAPPPTSSPAPIPSFARICGPTAHSRLIKRAASYPEVERIFVNAGVKKELCNTAGKDRAWLRKVRPWYLHDDHLHVRLSCPPGMAGCVAQDPVPEGDGCGENLRYWLSDAPYAADRRRSRSEAAAADDACRPSLRLPAGALGRRAGRRPDGDPDPAAASPPGRSTRFPRTRDPASLTNDSLESWPRIRRTTGAEEGQPLSREET